MVLFIYLLYSSTQLVYILYNVTTSGAVRDHRRRKTGNEQHGNLAKHPPGLDADQSEDRGKKGGESVELKDFQATNTSII